MTEGKNQASPSEQTALSATEEALELASFLESSPPSTLKITNNAIRKDQNSILISLVTPPLLLHCATESCNGPRTFRATDSEVYLGRKKGDVADVFPIYLCSNCRRQSKRYSLNVEIVGGELKQARVYKYGELPVFGPITSGRLLKLLGDQRETFLKGRRCESQGLGVGAFSYYRRVVENQKNKILDEIIKVSSKLGAPEDAITELQLAKAEQQFLKSVESVKKGIPQALLINGHNPLTLLHAALSVGLHEQTDERCLELAHDVRVVLGDLSERLSNALKDSVELNSAVGRLLRAREESPKKQFGEKALRDKPDPSTD